MIVDKVVNLLKTKTIKFNNLVETVLQYQLCFDALGTNVIKRKGLNMLQFLFIIIVQPTGPKFIVFGIFYSSDDNRLIHKLYLARGSVIKVIHALVK